jgi:hypothetical protein
MVRPISFFTGLSFLISFKNLRFNDFIDKMINNNSPPEQPVDSHLTFSSNPGRTCDRAVSASGR